MEKSMERGKGTLILTAAGLAACAVFFVYGIRNGLFTSEEAMAQFLSGLGMWGPFVFVALQVVQVVIPIMPGGISCLAGVLLFGPVWGFLYNYVGICIGSVLAFQIARRFGMPAVERAADDLCHPRASVQHGEPAHAEAGRYPAARTYPCTRDEEV